MDHHFQRKHMDIMSIVMALQVHTKMLWNMRSFSLYDLIYWQTATSYDNIIQFNLLKVPHYNADFDRTLPCLGSQLVIFKWPLYYMVSLTTLSISMHPKDSVIITVIMRLKFNAFKKHLLYVPESASSILISVIVTLNWSYSLEAISDSDRLPC